MKRLVVFLLLAGCVGSEQVAQQPGATIRQETAPAVKIPDVATVKKQLTPAQRALGDPVVNSIDMLLLPIPAGEFRMGSTAAEKEWAVGQEGGARFSSGGGAREAYEGESRPMRVDEGFWMGRTEVTVGQFRMFVASTGFVTDAEKPGGKTSALISSGCSRTAQWASLPIRGLSWKTRAGEIRIMASIKRTITRLYVSATTT